MAEESSPDRRGFTPAPFPSRDRRGRLEVPFVAVIGLHRSGSSCLAGVLHKLGVHMGDRLTGYEPSGGFEATDLLTLCETAYPFPSTEPAIPAGEIVERLRRHVVKVCGSAAGKGKPMAGGKYPHLCAMGDALREVCGEELRVVHSERPLEESIASLKERSRKETGWLAADDSAVERLQRWLWDAKEEFLQQVPHLDVRYADVLAEPRREVERIVSWLGIAPAEEEVDWAVAHVQPKSRPARWRWGGSQMRNASA